MKWLAYSIGFAFSIACAALVLGAIRAGLFIQDRAKAASGPDESSLEPFSQSKRFLGIGDWKVAYVDQGNGDPIVLLHGCPFQGYEYSRIIPILARHHGVVVPDLLELGDTVVRLDDDYRLPNEVKMVEGLMDRLGLESASFICHDHGAAICQLMMKDHPEKLRAVVLTNAEAYDLWPSAPERLDVQLVVNPLTTPFFRLLFGSRVAQRWIYRIAVRNRAVLSNEVLAAFTRPNISTPERWLRLRRFLSWQLDREHNLETMRAVDGMRCFRHPTLILWGQHDTNFGPVIAERLAHDIPGTVRIEWLGNSAHLPMLCGAVILMVEPHLFWKKFSGWHRYKPPRQTCNGRNLCIQPQSDLCGVRLYPDRPILDFV
jgi:2-hydroxymuconate-semialdehyde hydrolase